VKTWQVFSYIYVCALVFTWNRGIAVLLFGAIAFFVGWAWLAPRYPRLNVFMLGLFWGLFGGRRGRW
jgi:hypothetical protein